MKKSLFSLCLLATICVGCKLDVSSCFTTTISGSDVTFFSTCAIEAVSYQWDFGDGGTSTLANPTHTYTSSGTYTVILTVQDENGHASASSMKVTVNACAMACVNGQCINHACICTAGYEGIDCATPVNAKFSGIYSCVDSCSSSGPTGPKLVQVEPVAGTAQRVSFTGLWHVNNPVEAVVFPDGINFAIPRQPIDASHDISCSSSTISSDGDSISLSYMIIETGVSNPRAESCMATMTK